MRNHCGVPGTARLRSIGADRALRGVPFRPAHAGRLFQARRRQAARYHGRAVAAVHARPRDRRDDRSRRPRCGGGCVGGGWARGCGVSLDRLRLLCGVSARRGKSVRRAAPSRHRGGWRLCEPCAGAASALSPGLRAPYGGAGRNADVLGPHRLRGAETAHRGGCAGAGAAGRPRRRRDDGSGACPHLVRFGTARRRHRCGETDRGAGGRGRGGVRPGRFRRRARP